MSSDQPQQQPQQGMPIALEIIVRAANIVVVALPDGGKALCAVTPTGMQITIPMDAETARVIAQNLIGGLSIATAPLQNAQRNRQ